MKLFSSQRKLEESLKACPYVTLSEEKKNRLRKRIMRSLQEPREEEVFSFEALMERVRELALSVSPRQYFRALLKEKLLTLAEYQTIHGVSGGFRNRVLLRRVFATVLVVVFVVSVMFNFGVQIPQVEASYITLLEKVDGDVHVIRDAEVILGKAGFVLKADDTIRTGKGSKAVIAFMDQSVSRLDENTEVKITKLFINPTNKTETVVELALERGRLWSRVISLINNLSRFQVKAKNAVAVAKKKAAFDVAISDQGKAKVTTLKNKVDLVVATERKVMATTVMNGFSAEVKNTPLTVIPLPLKQEKISQTNDAWVQENLTKDEQYIETVKEEMKEQIQGTAVARNSLYKILSFDDFNQQKQVLEDARQKFSEAEMLAQKGEKEKAQALLLQFQIELQGVLSRMKEFETTQPAQVQELRSKMAELLDLYEKQLSMILPEDSLYEMKTALGDTRVLVADSPADKTETKISQASDKLFEAHDLVEKGDDAGAAEQVKAYNAAISEIASNVKDLPNDQKEQAVSAMIDAKSEAMKMLQAISSQGTSTAATPPLITVPSLQVLEPEEEGAASGTSSPEVALPAEAQTAQIQPDNSEQPDESEKNSEERKKGEDAQELRETLQDAKTETLTKLGEAVLQVQTSKQSSADVLQKLQDLKNDIDPSGRPLIDVTLGRDRLQIRSEGKVISVKGSTPPTTGSETPKLPQGPL